MCGLWTGIKNFGHKIKTGIKQGAKWAWNNRQGIAKALSTGAEVAGYFGVPYADKIKKGIDKFADIDKKISGLASSSSSNNSKQSDEPNVKISVKSKAHPKVSGNNYSINPRANGGTLESRRYNYESLR